MTSNTIAHDEVDDQSILITATRVPEDRRLQFSTRVFGRHHQTSENLVHDWMHEVAPDYHGGFWAFYQLSNGGFYMAPDLDCEAINVATAGNCYNGRMSPDAAGIVATLQALNIMAALSHEARTIALFDRLRDYASDHTDGPEIFRALVLTRITSLS